jgi:hypothetical protein
VAVINCVSWNVLCTFSLLERFTHGSLLEQFGDVDAALPTIALWVLFVVRLTIASAFSVESDGFNSYVN